MIERTRLHVSQMSGHIGDMDTFDPFRVARWSLILGAVVVAAIVVAGLFLLRALWRLTWSSVGAISRRRIARDEAAQREIRNKSLSEQPL